MNEPLNSIVVRINDYECRCSIEYDIAYCNIYRVFDYWYELEERFEINVRAHDFQLRSVVSEIGSRMQRIVEGE